MKTAEEILDEIAAENMINIQQMVTTKQLAVLAMRRYAKLYHESEVKKLNIPAVSNSLPVDYLQTEMIKAIKELAKESTVPDKVTPDWMENDIKRGMQWMHKRLTGNDC